MPCRYDAGTLARSIPRVTTRMTRVYDAANTCCLHWIHQRLFQLSVETNSCQLREQT